jgi:type IX secretion system PorP/SprF family membrane protein
MPIKTSLKRMLILLIPLLLGSTGFGQQMALQSQFLFNEYTINPAVAGYDGYTRINLSGREQWLGLPQSPKTHIASFQTRLLNSSYIVRKNPIRKNALRPSKMARVGLGAMVFDDRTGLISRTGFQITYAYHIPFQESQLSFGISAEGYQFKLNKDGVELNDPNDPYYLAYDFDAFVPDANFGVSFITRELSVGFSVHHLFQSALKLGNKGNNNYQTLRHYFISGGYKLVLSDDWLLHSYVLLKATNKFNSYQSDISSTLFFKNTYWLGLSYRTPKFIIIKAGVKIDRLYIGYAFDHSMDNLSRYSIGTHEFSLAYKFGGSIRRYRWLDHDLY